MSEALFKLPPLNRFSSRREWEEACWKKILESEKLLSMLVTFNERHNFIMRAAVVDRIRMGVGSRQIARELFLSPQTVSSIKKALGEGAYRSYRERGKIERKKRVYSRMPASRQRTHSGRRVRTKYGTIIIPQ